MPTGTMFHPCRAAFVLVAIGAALAYSSASAQHEPLFGLKAAAIEVGWYEPDVSFYELSEDFLLSFPGDPIETVQVEVGLLRFLTLRGGIGYWAQSDRTEIAVNDPLNARRHKGILRIVPLTATLYHEASWLGIAGVRPVIGGGIAQNLVQRTLERTRLDGSTPTERFEGNGRDFSYHVMAGLHRHLTGPVWLGLEARYVRGAYDEEADAGGARQEVSLDGWQYAASLRHRIR